MSRQVDERVVSMQFDNKHFEANVKTSMSTIDKLKAKLNFKGASKGLENVNSAAKKVNMSGLSGAVDTVRSRFSAMEIMGVTALANITNSAVNAGKRIAKALTIDPVTTGFNEYETKINSIQTILANTESKGTTMSDVTAALDELNTYADKTIYNFAEMTKNIGTFTAAGIGLEDSVSAIQGIANLAAVSGSTSQQASTAMYQLSQALSTGTVRLMDWNSVVNAGMGGEVFQNAIKETARVHGVAVDDIIKKSGSFRDSLSEEWLTADILTDTLKHFTMAAKEGSEEWEKYKKSLMAEGYTAAQAEAILKMANTATDAATKVKTFTQLLDTMKESVQSGWAKTWELVFGDFEKARDFFSGLSDKFGKIIEASSEARNKLLEGALSSPWDRFNSKIKEAGISTEDFQSKLKEVAKDHGYAVDDLIKEYGSLEKAMAAGKISTNVVVETLKKLAGGEKDASKSTEDMTDKLEYFQKVVNKVWHGDYANGEARVKALTEAGYDYAAVQDLVNKTVDGHKLTLEDLSDAQLKSVGYTDEQIKSIRELADEAEKSGTDLNTLISQMNKPSGRELLIDSFGNALQGLGAVMGSVKKAWQEIFPPMTSSRLYSIIEGINTFSKHLRVGEEAADKFKRTFKGVFAVLDIILTIVGGPIKIAFKLLTAILGEFDLSILDLTAMIGDAIVKFRDWIDNTLDFTAAAKAIVPPIKNAIKTFKNWIKTLKDSDNIPRDIVKGLVNGFGSGIKTVVNLAMELGKKIIETVKKVLGIHSPSTEFFEIGKNVILGLINGIRGGLSGLWSVAKTIGSKLLEMFGELDLGTAIAGGLSFGALAVVGKLVGVLGSFAAPLESLGDFMNTLRTTIKGLGKSFKKLANAASFKLIADGLLTMAKAILILAAAVVVLSFIEPKKLWNAVGAIAALGAVLTVLGIVISKMGAASNAAEAIAKVGLGASLFMIAAALLVMVFVIKQIDKLDGGAVLKGIGVIGLLGVFFAALVAIGRTSYKGAAKAGTMLFRMSIAMLVMVFVIKQIDKLDGKAILKGLGVVLMLSLFFESMVIVAKSSGANAKKIGSMMVKMAFALMLMVGVIKLIDLLEAKEIVKGTIVIAALGLFFKAMIIAAKGAGKNAGKIGSMLLQMSLAMLVLVGVIKLIDMLDGGAIAKGLGVILAFGAMFSALIWVAKGSGKNAKQIGIMLLAMAGAMLALTGVIYLIGKMDPGVLTQGLTVVVILGAMFAALIQTTKHAKNCMSTLIVLTAAIALLAGALVGLSFLDPMKLATATAALSMVIGVFALLIKATDMGKNTKQLHETMKSMRKTLIVLAAVVLILGGILVGLSFLDPKGVLAASASLSIIMLAFAGMTQILGKTKKLNKGVTTQIFIMLGVVGALALVVGVMSAIDATASLETAAALSLLLIAITGAFTILGYAKNVSAATIGKVALMAGIVMALAMVLGVLDHFDVDSSSIGAVTSISILLTALIGALIILGAANGIVKKAYSGIGALALMGLVVAELAAILVLMNKFDATPSIESIKGIALLLSTMTVALVALSLFAPLMGGAMAGIGALALMGLVVAELAVIFALIKKFDAMPAVEAMHGISKFIIAMSVAMIPLSLIGLLGPAAFIGIGALATLIVGIGGLLVGIGALVKYVPQVEEFLDKGLPVIEKIGTAIGSFFGNIVGGFLEGVSEGLPGIADNLSLFMEKLQPFIAGVKLIDEEALSGAARLAGIIALLSAAELIQGIVSMISGDASLGDLGTQLADFMTNAAPFIAGASLLNEEMTTAVKSLAQTVLILTAADVLEGLTSWITGGSSLTDFGSQLPVLGTYLSQFAANLGGFSEEQVNTVSCAATAIKNISEAAKDIPVTDDGLWQKIVGGKSIETFGGYLPTLATNLRGFCDNLGTFGDDQIATVSCAAEAIKNISEAAKDIPVTDDGIWQKIVGGKSIETFGGYLPTLGTNLKGFGDNLGTFGDDQVATVTCAAEAIKAIAAAANGIEGKGFWERLFGQDDFADFTSQLPTLGENLKSFVTSLGTFDDASISTVNAAVGALNALANLGSVDLGNFSKNVSTFGSKLKKLAENVKGFCDGMANVDGEGLDTAVSNVNKIVEMSKNIAAASPDIIGTFADSLKKLGKTGVDNFVSAFTDAADQFKGAGEQMVTKFIEGAESKTSTASDKFKSIASNSAEDLRDKYQSFYNAGSYLVEGFAAGISDNDYKAEAKARAMAKAAAEAAEEELEINSPSKVFRRIGTSIPEGFAQGIDKLGYVVANSSESMANTAVDGVKGSISNIGDTVSGDLSGQPTITPVLDLSEVRTGLAAISSMFGSNGQLGVSTDVNSIGYAMNHRGQNGANDDVVDAIGKLNDNLSDMDRPVYQIGNITLSGDDELTAAFETIIRYANIERRK